MIKNKEENKHDEAININPNGGGIGLTISKKYIENLGGELVFNSKYGVGTVVKFIIPLIVHSSLNNTNQSLNSEDYLDFDSDSDCSIHFETTSFLDEVSKGSEGAKRVASFDISVSKRLFKNN